MKLIVHNGSRIWGGNEKWLATLSRALLDRGHDVVVSCPPGAVRDRLAGMQVPTSAARPRGDFDLPSALHFSRWLARERPDALLLTSWTRLAWGAWAGRRADVPRIVARLGIVRAMPRFAPHTLAFRYGIDAMIVNAPEIRDEWARSAPFFPQSCVHIVLNGIRPGTTAPDRLRDELGVTCATVLVGGAGHLTPRKGFDLLLRAFAMAPLTDARLVIAGGGELADELRTLARAIGVAERVIWLGHRDDAPDVIAACDVFVLASRNEGMANVMLEAMAAGVPVVATEIAGVRAALAAENGGPPAGWIVPPEDPHAMAEAIAAAAAEGALSGRAAEAQRRIHTRFGIDRMADECEAILFADMR